MYHLELRQFPHVARAFNLSREELDVRFVAPWAAGSIVEHAARQWSPERSRLTILHGPELRADELGMGRGWSAASKSSEDVTDALLAEARRGAAARPEVEALKDAVHAVAATPIGFPDVIALVAAAHPQWRASEQLGLAEQAVWEMLHQGRLTMLAGTEVVVAERWQGIVLRWVSWTDGGPEALRLQVPGDRAAPSG